MNHHFISLIIEKIAIIYGFVYEVCRDGINNYGIIINLLFMYKLTKRKERQILARAGKNKIMK